MKRKLWRPGVLLAALVGGLLAGTAVAAASGNRQIGPIDTGDTAWLLASAAMVMLMTPALGFFYGGLARRKNVVNTIMLCFVALGVVSVQWVLWGYSLAFGPDHWGIIGDLSWFGLRNVGLEPSSYAGTVPHQAYMIFQGMFAIITPALVVGSFAERISFKAFLAFTLLWATLVYDPIAHWVWGQGGWLRTLGALDFAGGTVVHISSGVSALAAALVLGRRLGYGREAFEPHDVTMVILGAALLWFGWFGFNAGSAVASGSLATSAFVVTHVAAAMSALAWMTMSWILSGKPTAVGAASGAVAGLVAITPASGFVTPMAAIVIGLGAGILCYLAVRLLKERLRVDDALDVWGCHGIGGTWGALATGIFATAAIGGIDGWVKGNPGQMVNQLAAIGATWVYAFGMTWIILKVLSRFMPLRVSQADEEAGLDTAVHGELAYK